METRFRLLFAIVIVVAMMFQFSPPGLKAQFGVQGANRGGLLVVLLLSTMLAGAGVATQPAFQANKGLHESTFFTLSMPVSRFRLLAVRAGLGWLELVGVIAMMCSLFWILFPDLRGATSGEEMLMHGATLTACATGLYSINVLMTTFLADPWRVPGIGLAYGALWLLFTYTPLPSSTNLFRAMGDASPLMAHATPWPAMLFSLGLAAVSFFAALKIVRMREY